MKPSKVFLIFLFCFLFLQTARADWTKQNSGTLAWLRSVYFINENKGWVVGSNGTLLTTEDGGENWKQAKKIIEDNIRDVYFLDSQNGWLLCERNVYGGDTSSPSYLLKTTDGGENWEKIKIIGETRERVVRIFFSENGNGFAVGEAGALWTENGDKESWKKKILPVRYLMLDGKFTGSAHGAIVGGGGTILFTEDGGATWSPGAVETRSEAKLNSIFFINQSVGWTVGELGRILFTNNGGRFWHQQNSNISKNLSDVFFINTAEGWAVGDDGTILYTVTAGNVWSPQETGVRHKLEKVFFVGRKGFAVGFGGTILTYDKKQTEQPSKRQPQLQKRNTV